MDTDAANATLALESSAGRLVIRALSREAADPAGQYWDANWLATTVEVRSGEFAARLRASLRTDELAGFLLELRRLNAGEVPVARFRSIEGWLSLDLAVADDHAVATGAVKEPSDPANELRFAIRGLDGADVDRAVDELERILADFPVLGRRDH